MKRILNLKLKQKLNKWMENFTIIEFLWTHLPRQYIARKKLWQEYNFFFRTIFKGPILETSTWKSVTKSAIHRR